MLCGSKSLQDTLKPHLVPHQMHHSVRRNNSCVTLPNPMHCYIIDVSQVKPDDYDYWHASGQARKQAESGAEQQPSTVHSSVRYKYDFRSLMLFILY